MTGRFDVDRLIEDWLAEGPSQLPDRAVDGIVRQLDETPQRTHLWLLGREQMNRMIFALGGVAAAVVVAVVALGIYFSQPGIGEPPVATPSPSPIPTASPSPTSAATVFESERHGYTVTLPDDSWSVIEFPGTWQLGETWSENGPGADSFFQPGTNIESQPYILINSQSVDGVSFDDWLDDYDEANGRAFPHCEVQGSEPSSLGGVSGQLRTVTCDDWSSAELVAFHADRAYALRVFPRSDSATGDPRTIIDDWRTRIEFIE